MAILLKLGGFRVVCALVLSPDVVAVAMVEMAASELSMCRAASLLAAESSASAAAMARYIHSIKQGRLAACQPVPACHCWGCCCLG